MNLLPLAYGYGAGSWVAHMVASSIVQALIYGTLFRVMRHLTLAELVVTAAVVIGLIYLRARERDVRRW